MNNNNNKNPCSVMNKLKMQVFFFPEKEEKKKEFVIYV